MKQSQLTELIFAIIANYMTLIVDTKENLQHKLKD